MNNVLLLIKNYFSSYIGGFLKNKKVGKYINAILLIVLFCVMMIAFFTYSAYTTTKEFINLDKENYTYVGYAMYMACSNVCMLTFLFIVLRSTAPAKSSDANLLLSMPIKKSQIIIAKSLSAYIFNLAALICFLFPNFLMYYLMVKSASIGMVFRSLIVIFTLSLFINGLSTIIGTLMNKFTKKLKLTSLIQTVLLFILVAVFLVFNYTMNDVLTKNSNLPLDEILNKVFIIKIFYYYILNNKVIYYLIILGISLVAYIISIFVYRSEFGKEIVYLKSEIKSISYKENSPFVQLLKKEANRYFTSPIYIMNTSFGAILTIGAVIYVMISGRAIIDITIMQLLKLDSSNSPYVILLLVGVLLTTICTASCSISLEGKNFWILKANPIKEKTIFYSKILFNVILSGGSGIIVSILIGFIFGFKYLPLYLSFILLLTILISSIGLYINLLYPKMEWDSEVVPIKQSMSIIISMSMVIIPIIFLALYVVLNSYVNPTLLIMIFNIVLIIINIGVYYLLNTKGTKLFKSI